MPSEGYFVLLEGKPRGPFDLDQLRELVGSGALGGHSPAATSPEGPFARLDQMAPGSLAPATGAISVHQILRQNKNRERAAGIAELKPMPPRRSRRRRDFLVLSTLGLLFGGGIIAWVRPPPPMLFGIGGMLLFFVAALWWVMFIVTDDY